MLYCYLGTHLQSKGILFFLLFTFHSQHKRYCIFSVCCSQFLSYFCGNVEVLQTSLVYLLQNIRMFRYVSVVGEDNSTHCVLFINTFWWGLQHVCHSICLYRPISIGILHTPLDYLKSFISGCTQFVHLQSLSSKLHPVTTYVPLGSVLRPLLFVIYLLPIGFCLCSLLQKPDCTVQWLCRSASKLLITW